MRDNPLQFAVMREDPTLEVGLVREHALRRPLLVASGGCTALALAAEFPGLAMDLVDPNPAQLAQVMAKVEALRATEGDATARARAFNLGDDDPAGLSARGNFESLFRGFRDFLREFVAPAEELRALLSGSVDPAHLRARVFAHPYWRVAFELFFHDSLLTAMFGPAAVQHAVPGSYPTYFRGVLERGWTRPDATTNPFLHHVFWGCYAEDPAAWPRFLQLPVPESHRFRYVEGTLDAVEDFGAYDLISLSNVFDWSDPPAIAALAARLRAEARPGAVIVIRQLNHTTDLRSLFEPSFQFDDALGAHTLAQDRSLFYAAYRIGRHR